MGAGRGGHSGRDEKPCGDDDKESEKEMESMKDRLFPFEILQVLHIRK